MDGASRALSAARALVFSKGALVAVGAGVCAAAVLSLHPTHRSTHQFPKEMRTPKEMTIPERLQARVQRALRSDNRGQQKEVQSWISDRAPQPLIAMGLNRTAQPRDGSQEESGQDVDHLMQSLRAAPPDDTDEAAGQQQETLLPKWAWGAGVIMIMPLWPWAYVVGRKQRISAAVANRFGQFGRSFDADLKRRAENREYTRNLRHEYQRSREQAQEAAERARREAEGPQDRAARLQRERQWRQARARAEQQARARAAHAWRTQQEMKAREATRKREAQALGEAAYQASTQAELRAAWRTTAARLHPDKHAGASESEQARMAAAFTSARQAYEDICRQRGFKP